jgi:hypothetical protein
MIRAWVRQNGDNTYEAGFVSVETPDRQPASRHFRRRWEALAWVLREARAFGAAIQWA